MERIGFWHRALAAGLDVLIGGFTVGAGSIAAVAALSHSDTAEALSDYIVGIVASTLLLAYTSTEVWLAASPGKLVLGLRIAAYTGPVASKWTLALRWSSKYFGAFVFFVYAVTTSPLAYYLGGFMNNVVLVGCLQALDEHRRAWHDEWAGTAVYRRRDLLAAAGPSMPPPLPVAGSITPPGADDAGRV